MNIAVSQSGQAILFTSEGHPCGHSGLSRKSDLNLAAIVTAADSGGSTGELRDEFGIPIIYVSHAPDEVARLADHLVLLDAGRVVASGPLTETLARADLPPAFADDAGVVVAAVVAAHEADDLTRLDFAGGSILVARRPEAVGHRLRCRIHARDVSLALQAPQASSILNSIAARIVDLADCATPTGCLGADFFAMAGE